MFGAVLIPQKKLHVSHDKWRAMIQKRLDGRRQKEEKLRFMVNGS